MLSIDPSELPTEADSGPDEPVETTDGMARGALFAHRYCLLEPLGRGGMGRVWLGTHIGLGKLVAIKVLHEERHANYQTRERFRREALVGGCLDHPRIVQPLDFGTLPDGRDYLVLHYVQGKTVKELVGVHGPLPWPFVLRLANDVVSALECAHHKQVIHRDLKPSNLVVDGGDLEEGATMVLDFGIARFETFGIPALTTKGTMLGTPQYASPEQLHGQPVDGRSDLYSLGAVLYYALAGQVPFSGNASVIAVAQGKGPGPLPIDPQRPKVLDRLVYDLLAPDPADRPKDAKEVAKRLRACTTSERPLWPYVAAVAAAALGTALYFLL